jgi:hypothetical protein
MTALSRITAATPALCSFANPTSSKMGRIASQAGQIAQIHIPLKWSIRDTMQRAYFHFDRGDWKRSQALFNRLLHVMPQDAPDYATVQSLKKTADRGVDGTLPGF